MFVVSNFFSEKVCGVWMVPDKFCLLCRTFFWKSEVLGWCLDGAWIYPDKLFLLCRTFFSEKVCGAWMVLGWCLDGAWLTPAWMVPDKLCLLCRTFFRKKCVVPGLILTSYIHWVELFFGKS
jgi:hypothetical protein